MKSFPESMMAALVAHNNLIEKAKWANFGSVIEQEGDSYSLIFEEAGDAVKFCLQVGLLEKLGNYVRAKSFGLTTSLPSITSAWFSVSPEAVPHVRSG